MRPFLANDQPHALRPALKDVAGEFGDPCSVADLAAGLEGRGPGGCRDSQDVLVEGPGDYHADGVGQPSSAPGKPAHELVGASRGVAADQSLPPAPVLLRQLGQGEAGGLALVGGSVRARVPGPEQSGDGFARFLTIFGSKEPSRSRSTTISTGPTSVSTVLERLPLRELPPFLPTGSCLS